MIDYNTFGKFTLKLVNKLVSNVIIGMLFVLWQLRTKIQADDGENKKILMMDHVSQY